MNLDDLLNMSADTKMNKTIKLLQVTNFFYPSGSRSVLKEPYITEETDHDFISLDSSVAREKAMELGYKEKKIDQNYMDVSSSVVFENKELNSQIVFKKVKYWEKCLIMWEHFRMNPDFFRDNFWKSNKDKVITQDEVRNKINLFIENFS